MTIRLFFCVQLQYGYDLIFITYDLILIAYGLHFLLYRRQDKSSYDHL